ncbi:uncharacterized protein MONOS_14043 [Monocercomonoides exilis]|uniref:uncharacterized protein n=1 Tax=Monocercomonoides exilis TaxID=2049356 RepID=UPI00355992A9|nr:hypothetical protein MONOS_14043 [Monocercomonoides exilis]|eukprot:MONOS_14043.1-p1 / transcript=MONOS_14043.1 / gene=MONOS_14043 / organism=Monocercomonoides_exilis_PA203 / gene_product=unspecified product / transcript_product=unspecified product / location=Mono_scaffold00927:4294-5180(-) / protein_length=263 / sequence_SO=supercontig / SO=protein_coding / is_pseudo=false
MLHSISMFSTFSFLLSIPSVGLLSFHLNCYPLPQRCIPLCFSTSYSFRAKAVLNGVNEVNGHRRRNGSGKRKELSGTLLPSSRIMAPPRSEGREAHAKWKRQRWRIPEVNLAQSRGKGATERRRRDREREEGGDENDDEQQQTFYSFGSTLSSAQLHTQNITASSTFASPPFSSLPHTQLSAPSVLVGTSPEPLSHSSPATFSSSLAQKSLDITEPKLLLFLSLFFYFLLLAAHPLWYFWKEQIMQYKCVSEKERFRHEGCD